ncbi:MAG: metal-sensitive transcriptional regulator [Bacillota bacterium]
MKGLDPEIKRSLINRLRRIEGQARGVQRMLEEERDCMEVLSQLVAMREAINRVGMQALGCQLGTDVRAEITGGGTGEKAVARVVEHFLKFT